MIKLILKTLPAIIFTLVFFTIEPAYAQSATATPISSQQILAQLQQLVGVILSMLSILIWPLLSMIGALMGNDLIFGPQVEDRLLLIWGQIRNFINLAFVLVLVGLALYNVAGIGEESNYTLKKILPRFIIALIVVNFTFFGAKVILSSVNVLTTAVFALPNNIEGSLTSLNPSGIASRMCPTVAELYPENGFCIDQSTFTPQAEQFFSRFSGDNIAYIMAINYAQIGDILQVSERVRQVPTIQSVTVNILISLLMYFVYTIAFVVMFIVLVVRVVVLWFVIALSPILALQIVFPEGTKNIVGEFDIKDIFIKHAFAPAIIGMGLVIGHMLLDAYSQNTAPSLGSSLALGADFGNAFSVGSDGIQQILIGVAAAVVIWKVSFTAADGTLAKGVTNALKGWVERTAGDVAKLPAYAQILPVPKSVGNGSGKAALAGLPFAMRDSLDQMRIEGQNSLLPRSTGEGEGADSSSPPRGLGALKNYVTSNEYRDPRMNEGVIRTLSQEQRLQQQLTVGRLKEIVQFERDQNRLNPSDADNIIDTLLRDAEDSQTVDSLGNRNRIFSVLERHSSIERDGRELVRADQLEREDLAARDRAVASAGAAATTAAAPATTASTSTTPRPDTRDEPEPGRPDSPSTVQSREEEALPPGEGASDSRPSRTDQSPTDDNSSQSR